MSTPHKHAALIHAWADGAEIEYRAAGSAIWMPMPTPQWSLIGDYRIKPDPLKIAIEALEKIYKVSTDSWVLDASKEALKQIKELT